MTSVPKHRGSLVALGGLPIAESGIVYVLPRHLKLDGPPVERVFRSTSEQRPAPGTVFNDGNASRLVNLYIQGRYDNGRGRPPTGPLAFSPDDILLEFHDGRPGGLVTKLDLSISANMPIFHGRVTRIARDEIYRTEQGYDDLRPCAEFSLVSEPVIVFKIEALGFEDFRTKCRELIAKEQRDLADPNIKEESNEHREECDGRSADAGPGPQGPQGPQGEAGRG
jgi:hypothetical protein